MQIENLFYDYFLKRNDFSCSSIDKYERLTNIVAKYKNALDGMIDDEAMRIFEKYCEASNTLHDKEKCEYFTEGFIMGAKIMLEVMHNDNQ